MRALREAFLFSLFTLSVVLTGCSKPEDPAVVHRGLGNEYARKGDWAAAVREYGLAAQANPQDRKIWELKANAHLRLGQVREAGESLAKPAEYTSDPVVKAEIYRLLASMYVENREVDEAEKAFVEALKYNPRDELALSWLGEIASTRGGARKMTDPADPVWLAKAIAYYDQAIAVNPDNLFTYVHKRVALTKYISYEQQEKASADRLTQLERKDASKVEAARTRVTQSAARIEGFEKQVEELSKKIKEMQAAEKAKKRGAS